MELKNKDLFLIIKDKKFEEALLELSLIRKETNEIFYKLIFLPLIKMNYLNYIYELIIFNTQYQQLFQFIQLIFEKNKKEYYPIFINHLEYTILKIPDEENAINYCISFIKNIYNSINNFFNEKNIKINGNSYIFNSLFNNPNLSFESKLKIYEELIDIIGLDIIKDKKFTKKINNLGLLYFINFYKNKVLNKIPLSFQNENNLDDPEIHNQFKNIMSEFYQIGYLFEFIYKLSLKSKNKRILKYFQKYLDTFIKNHPFLTKKYKYYYSNKTFQIIKEFIFLNAKNEYFSNIEEKIDENLLFEFIINDEKLSNFNLIEPKNALFLEKIILSNKYDYTEYIINNWNTIFPLNINKEKKYIKEKPEIDGDKTDSEEENELDEEEEEVEEEFLINLDNFIKSLLSLDYSNCSKIIINYDKLFTFLESKMHVITKYYSYSIIPNYYDMHKNLMKKNQPPSYYRFCLNYIISKNININFKHINNPEIGIYNFMSKGFKPEMNIFIRRTINNLVYNWEKEFYFTEFINEIKQRPCIYCLLLINSYDSIENRLKDVQNFFNNFLYILDSDLENKLIQYKEVMIYYCNNLKYKSYKSTKFHKKVKNYNNNDSIIDQKNSYWLNFYKIMILIYIRKKYSQNFNPELLWECLNNYYDIKGVFNLLVNFSKDMNNNIEIIFEKELIPRFCLFTNKRVYFNVLNKIREKEYIKLLVNKRNELGISDISNLFIEILERLLINKILFNYLWESFDNIFKMNLIKQFIKTFIKAYLNYSFKRFHFFQNKILEGLKLILSNEELKTLKLLEPLKEEFPIKIDYNNLKIN